MTTFNYGEINVSTLFCLVLFCPVLFLSYADSSTVIRFHIKKEEIMVIGYTINNIYQRLNQALSKYQI